MFEWDVRKAMSNLAKHNVSFEEAATVFGDEDAFDSLDVLHSTRERRRLRLGMSSKQRLLWLAYTIRRTEYGETLRIISARPANREEELGYTGRQD